MNRVFITHKTEYKPPIHTNLEPKTLCGAYSAFHSISATVKWKYVTCKKCLKKKVV